MRRIVIISNEIRGQVLDVVLQFVTTNIVKFRTNRKVTRFF